MDEPRALCHILSSKLAARHFASYESFSSISSLLGQCMCLSLLSSPFLFSSPPPPSTAESCPDNATVLSHLARYFLKIGDWATSEKLFVASLLLDGRHDHAFLGLAHLLAARAGQVAQPERCKAHLLWATRYLSRVSGRALFHSQARLEGLWIREWTGRLSPSAPGGGGGESLDADVKAYKATIGQVIGAGKGLADGLEGENRIHSCLLHSLAHKLHCQSAKEAIVVYTRALSHDRENPVALLLLAMAKCALLEPFSAQLEDEIDGHYRRGLAFLPPSSSSRCLGKLSYADFLCHRLGDWSRAEEYYLDAMKEARGRCDSVWVYTFVAAVEFFAEVLGHVTEANLVILRLLRERHPFDASSSSSFLCDLPSFHHFYTPSGSAVVEEAHLHLAPVYVCVAHFLLRRGEGEDVPAANRFVAAALGIDKLHSPAWRCAAVALLQTSRPDLFVPHFSFTSSSSTPSSSSSPEEEVEEEVRKRSRLCVALENAVEFVKASLECAPRNPFALFTLAVCQYLRGHHLSAIASLREAVLIRRKDVLAHLLLGALLCRNGQEWSAGLESVSTATSLLHQLSSSSSSSRNMNVSLVLFHALRMKGQLLLFLFRRAAEAARCFEECLRLRIGDPTSLAGLGLCWHLQATEGADEATTKAAKKDRSLRDVQVLSSLSSSAAAAAPFSLVQWRHANGSLRKTKRRTAVSSLSSISDWEQLLSSHDADLLMEVACKREEVASVPMTVVCWIVLFEGSKGSAQGRSRALRTLCDALRLHFADGVNAAPAVEHVLLAVYLLALLLEGSDSAVVALGSAVPVAVSTVEKCFSVIAASADRDPHGFLAVAACVEWNIQRLSAAVSLLGKEGDPEGGDPEEGGGREADPIEEEKLRRAASAKTVKRKKAKTKTKKKSMDATQKADTSSATKSASTPHFNDLLRKLSSLTAISPLANGAEEGEDEEGGAERGERERNGGGAEEHCRALADFHHQLQLLLRFQEQISLQQLLHAKKLKAAKSNTFKNLILPPRLPPKEGGQLHPLLPFSSLSLSLGEEGGHGEWSEMLLQACRGCEDWTWMMRCSRLDRGKLGII